MQKLNSYKRLARIYYALNKKTAHFTAVSIGNFTTATEISIAHYTLQARQCAFNLLLKLFVIYLIKR